MLLTGWLKNWISRRRTPRLRRGTRRFNGFPAYVAAECLEVRTLPSSVFVSFGAGFLNLVGDTGDHNVAVSASGSNLQLTGSSGTMFNYKGNTSSSVSIPFTSIRGIQFFMSIGNDAISVDGTNMGTVSNCVNAFLGSGTNSFQLQHATVTGSTLVVGGGGADTVGITNDTLHNLSLYTGGGNDAVTVSSITLSADQVYADLISAVPSLAPVLGDITVGGSL